MPEQVATKTRRLPAAFEALFWPVLALVLLLVFNALFTPNYLKVEMVDGRLSGYLIDIFRDGAAVMLVALGMTLVIGTGGVDLSVGAIMAIAAVLAAAMVTPAWLGDTLGPWAVDAYANHPGAWVALLLVVSLAAAAVVGMWNGLLVSVLRVQPIIATLILMVSGRGLAQLICGGQIYLFDDEPSLRFIGQGTLLGLPFSLWLVAAMLIVTALLTRRTALGLMIESVGDNDLASHYAGLRARTIKFMVYAFSGLCAGVAGLIESTNVSSANANKIGLWFELDAIFAVVVGGTALTGGRFFIIGSVVGALLIQTLTNTMYVYEVRPEVALIPKALIILAVCLLQSAAFRRRVVGALTAPFKSKGTQGNAAAGGAG